MTAGSSSGVPSSPPADLDVATDVVANEERVPRGRCMPPSLPSPNPRSATSMPHGRKHSATRATKGSGWRRQSRIILLPNGRSEPRKPLPKWKRGYLGFKRKVKSRILVPLLLLLGAGGLATHVISLTGVSMGYFVWRIECEGVVSIIDENRASGLQQYYIGWAGYQGTGPRQASDTVALTGNPTGSSEAHTDPSFGRAGIAGSSISEQNMLGSVDKASAAFGILMMFGHFYGVVFHLITVGTLLQLLFQTQFRDDRPLFVPAAKASAVLFVWMASFGAVGFSLLIRYNLTASIASTLHEEGFLCADESADFEADYALIATGFGCVDCGLTLFLTSWYGTVADGSLADRFKRNASVPEVQAEPTTDPAKGVAERSTSGRIETSEK